MFKISILMSFTTKSNDAQPGEELYQSFQKQFVEKYPDAKVVGTHIGREVIAPSGHEETAEAKDGKNEKEQ